MSWRPEVSEEKRRFLMPTYWGMNADLLISSHWAGKDRKIFSEHENFYRLVLQLKQEVMKFKAHNKKEEAQIQEIQRAVAEYDQWMTKSGRVDFVTVQDSKNWLKSTEFRVRGFGRIQLAPEKVSQMRLAGLPPVRYIRGRISLDDLIGDRMEMGDRVIYYVAGIRARIWECHSPDTDYDSCVLSCFQGEEKCPYLVGPAYSKNVTRMDAGLYHSLLNIAHRQLLSYKTRILKPLWEVITTKVQADEISKFLGSFKDEEREQSGSGD